MYPDTCVMFFVFSSDCYSMGFRYLSISLYKYELAMTHFPFVQCLYALIARSRVIRTPNRVIGIVAILITLNPKPYLELPT